MRTLMSLTLAAAVAAGCSSDAVGATAPTPVSRPITIVALGDSLTSGHGLSRDHAYPAVLERQFQAAGLPVTVVNHGVSGDTTAGGVRRLSAALDIHPDILIVALGANDGLRGVPVAQIRANLDTIIQTAQTKGIDVLLCGMEALPLYGWQYTVDFHGIFPSLAAKYNLSLVPFLLQGVFGNQEMLLPDMAHPNVAGAAQIAHNIWPYLHPMVTSLDAPAVVGS
jgi:acyl-CoA thioesterase I